MLFIEFFETIDMLKTKVFSLEKEIKSLKESHLFEKQQIKNNLTRISNQQNLSQLMITGEVSYFDLSPKEAFDIYNDSDISFQILDITENDKRSDIQLECTQHIPYSELENRITELKKTSTPLLVISEKGLYSILACNLLAKEGFYNVNNVSGGYVMWGKSEYSEFKASA